MISEIDRKIRTVVDELVNDFPGDVDFAGSDEHDRHVNAAATHARADILVTDNTRDFGDPDLLPYDLYPADAFLCLIDDGAPACVRLVTREQNSYWQERRSVGRVTTSLLDALRRAGCPHFASRVDRHLRAPSGRG
ncbi:hypothetical protein C5B96_15970 [Subtercola sp. Z020]|uniref:hypothetical protein n=1 Tax=Subtercola sp. Z020 TaxID=2080582 RepID=UPI000CE87FCC|nr:hypothetical protein [Subtercola sp. Z020]PPF77074.1 hypothetical protein C5B96_15970 [Subtercola sp. Z020]